MPLRIRPYAARWIATAVAAAFATAGFAGPAWSAAPEPEPTATSEATAEPTAPAGARVEPATSARSTSSGVASG